MLKDAMGNEIKIGSYYAYSNRTNGIVKITIGEAISFSEDQGKVTLKVLHKGSSAYEKPIKENKISRKNSIVLANSIFKIENPKINWI